MYVYTCAYYVGFIHFVCTHSIKASNTALSFFLKKYLIFFYILSRFHVQKQISPNTSCHSKFYTMWSLFEKKGILFSFFFIFIWCVYVDKNVWMRKDKTGTGKIKSIKFHFNFASLLNRDMEEFFLSSWFVQ